MSSTASDPSSRHMPWRDMARLRLAEIDDTSSLPKELAFERAEEQLRELVDIVRLFRARRNNLLPAARLPTEILGDIFSFVVAVEPETNIEDTVPSVVSSRAKAARDRTAITHVCHQWREIALAHSVLWKNVVCRTPEQCAEVLAHSRALPLTLSADISEGPAERTRAEAARACLAELARVEDLALHTTPAAMESLGKDAFGPASRLASLRLHCRLGNSVRLPPTMLGEGEVPLPSLRHLVLCDCILPWDTPIFSNLVHLELQMQGDVPMRDETGASDELSQGELYDILSATTRLKTLILIHMCPSQASNVPFTHWPQIPRLPHLENLRLRGRPMDIARVYANLHMPVTVTVVLQLGFVEGVDVQEARFAEALPWLCVRDCCVLEPGDRVAISASASAPAPAPAPAKANVLSIVTTEIKPSSEDLLNMKFQLSTVPGLSTTHSKPAAHRELAAHKPFHTLELQFYCDDHEGMLWGSRMAYEQLPLGAVRALSLEGVRLRVSYMLKRLFSATHDQHSEAIRIHTLYLDLLKEASGCIAAMFPRPEQERERRIGGARDDVLVFPTVRHVVVREPIDLESVRQTAAGAIRKIRGVDIPVPEFWCESPERGLYC